MASTPQNRKTAVVDSHVQWTLALRVVLHFFIFVCAGCVFGLINQFLADPMAGLQANLTSFWRQSAPLVLALVCLIPIFVRDTLTLSNRIAGPIYNLRRTCRQLADGQTDVRPLKFRKGDMWSDLPDLFNRMTTRLRSQHTADSGSESAKHGPSQQRELVEV
ncbi:MAG: hypothetical protein R3C59_18305 [Planctomycetaceae bacterium]